MEPVTESLRNSPFAIYAAVVLAAVSYIFLARLNSRRRYSPPLSPGPRGLPLVGYLPYLEPDLHFHFAKLAAVHGPIFLLKLGGKLGVFVSSAAAASEVLRDQDVTFAHRDVPVASHVMAYDSSGIGWACYGPMWRMLRKVCVQEMLAGHTLDAFYGLRRREVRAMVRRVAECARARNEVNVGKEVFLTSMGVVSRMLWGAGEGAEIVSEEFKGMVGEILELAGIPNVSDFLPWLRRLDLQGIEKKIWALRKRFDGLFQQAIAAREQSQCSSADSDKAECFLDVMLRMEATDGGDGDGDGEASFTRSNTKGIFVDMVLAGSETVSNTVEFAMAEMMNKSETIRKAQAELDELVGSDTVIEESHAMKLPYLAAVVKETLRLHPPGPLLVPRCPSADCVVGGYTVPAGTIVYINAWAIHHDSTTWEDPFTFNVERFLGKDAGRLDFSGNDLTYIPFGSGRRSCVGRAMGERTVAYVLATLLHAFDWQLPNEVKEIKIEERFGLTVKMKNPLTLLPKLRLSEPHLYQ